MLLSSLPAQCSQRVCHGWPPAALSVSFRNVQCRIDGLGPTEGKKLGLVSVPVEAIPQHPASPSDSH